MFGTDFSLANLTRFPLFDQDVTAEKLIHVRVCEQASRPCLIINSLRADVDAIGHGVQQTDQLLLLELHSLDLLEQVQLSFDIQVDGELVHEDEQDESQYALSIDEVFALHYLNRRMSNCQNYNYGAANEETEQPGCSDEHADDKVASTHDKQVPHSKAVVFILEYAAKIDDEVHDAYAGQLYWHDQFCDNRFFVAECKRYDRQNRGRAPQEQELLG